jgi:putative peptide zinc metalloprotease protein
MASNFPKLRDDLVIKKQVLGGEVTYIIKVRETQQYLRFREMEWAIISRLDGNTDFEELARQFNAQFADAELDAGQVEDFVDSLRKQELIVRTPAERSIVILEKLQAERKKRAEQSQAKDVFYLTLATVNPDKFYKKVYPYLRWIWTPQFVVFSLLYFAAAATVVIASWAAVREGMLKFWSFSEKSPADLVMLFCILAVVIAVHESAHALTCIHFGGEVTELGCMLIFFMPAFYANVSDAYLFDKKWHKYWVTLAGGYSELVICATAVFAWVLTQPDTFLHHLAYNVMVFAGISTIIFNYNPLIKLDGYYLLSDILETGNLRDNSAKYISYLLRTRIFHVTAKPPGGLTPRKKRIYLIYGIFSSLYVIFIVTLFVLFLLNFFMSSFPEVGLFLGLFASFMILRKRVRKFMDFSRFVFLDKRELFRTKKSAQRWAVAGSVLLLALLFYPFGRTISAPVQLEPVRVLRLTAEVPGEVQSVMAQSAEPVEAGTVIIRLRNTELSLRREAAEGRLELLSAEAARALHVGDLAGYRASLREQRSASEELEELRRKESRLLIRAPFTGHVLTTRLGDLVGRYVRAGDFLCEFADLQLLRGRVQLTEFALRDVREAQQVRFQLTAYPAESFSGNVAWRSLASADAYDAGSRDSELVRVPPRSGESTEPGRFAHFEVLTELPNPHLRLRPGMTGNVKISVDRKSVAGRIARNLADLLRSRVWW